MYCRRVASVSADGKTVTLDSPLTYTHVRVTETYGTATVDMAGEVGLLSHNVRFRGYGDPEWVTNITKCEAGFDTGRLSEENKNTTSPNLRVFKLEIQQFLENTSVLNRNRCNITFTIDLEL